MFCKRNRTCSFQDDVDFDDSSSLAASEQDRAVGEDKDLEDLVS
jgi:hypothetical protein